MMDDTWVVTGDHLDMAKDILYDLFKNLIQWLEGEVEVGAKKMEKENHRKDWLEAYNNISPVELDKRGEGWRKKSAVLKQFQANHHITRPTAFKKFNDWAAHLFDAATHGRLVVGISTRCLSQPLLLHGMATKGIFSAKKTLRWSVLLFTRFTLVTWVSTCRSTLTTAVAFLDTTFANLTCLCSMQRLTVGQQVI
jgi:hypothetical protein